MGCLKLTYHQNTELKIISNRKELTSNKSDNKGYRSYLYGFQGQEKDDEVKGSGNSLNYKFRMHDPRIGRFFAVDPLAPKYPHNSPYAFSENNVIAFIELEGLEKYYAADGTYLGKYGDNTNIRVVNDNEVEATKAAFVAYHKNPQEVNNYLGMYIGSNSFSTSFRNSSKETKLNIFRTIFTSLGGSEDVNLGLNSSDGASCACDGNGGGINGKGASITISANYNDQNDIEFLMHKEIIHLTDSDVAEEFGETGRDLLAHYTAISEHKELWKSTSLALKKTILKSSVYFTWQTESDVEYFTKRNDVFSANFYKNTLDTAKKRAKEVGIEIDYSKMLNNYDGVNFPSPYSAKQHTQGKVNGKIIYTGKHYKTD